MYHAVIKKIRKIIDPLLTYYLESGEVAALKKSAILSKNQLSMHALGNIYENGTKSRCIKPDYAEAYIYYTLAQYKGYAGAGHDAMRMKALLSPEQLDEAYRQMEKSKMLCD